MSSSEPKLSPLSCPQCGAAVPLGEGTIARCTYCSIAVPVPAQYIALRDEATRRAAQAGGKADASAVIRELVARWMDEKQPKKVRK